MRKRMPTQRFRAVMLVRTMENRSASLEWVKPSTAQESAESPNRVLNSRSENGTGARDSIPAGSTFMRVDPMRWKRRRLPRMPWPSRPIHCAARLQSSSSGTARWAPDEQATRYAGICGWHHLLIELLSAGLDAGKRTAACLSSSAILGSIISKKETLKSRSSGLFTYCCHITDALSRLSVRGRVH